MASKSGVPLRMPAPIALQARSSTQRPRVASTVLQTAASVLTTRLLVALSALGVVALILFWTNRSINAVLSAIQPHISTTINWHASNVPQANG